MSVVISPVPFQFLPSNNNTGVPAAGFKLFTYQAGTTTKQSTWTDSTQTVANANPILLDANGFIAASSGAGLWIDPTLNYKFVLALPTDTDPPASPLRTQDNVSGYTTLPTLVTGVYGTDSGAVNAYIFTHSGPIAVTQTKGVIINFTPLNTNTGASTLNADGTGAVAIIGPKGVALAGGELSSLGPVVLQSTGTQWQIVSTSGTAIAIATQYSSLQAAINANGGGQVFIPPGTYALGNTSLVFPANGVRLTGSSRNGAIITYSGTGSAIDCFTNSAQNWCIEHLTINCTNDAANGIKAGNASQHQEIDDVAISGTSTLTATGAGLLLDAGTPGSFSGNLSVRLFYCIGFKYGVQCVGHSLGTNTWTTMTFIHCFLIGRPAGIITGSRGFWMDALTNGVGSCYLGGTIEGFDTALWVDTGGAGLDFASDIEGNNNTFGGGSIAGTLGSTFAGRIKQTNATGNSYEQAVNSTTNRWFQRQQLNGVIDEDTYYGPRQTIYDDSTNDAEWNLYRGPASSSFISGTGNPQKKFGVHIGVSGSSSPPHHYIFLNGNTLHFDSQSPQVTGGPTVWAVGDTCLNTTASGPIGWICTVSGAPGTWVALVSIGTQSTGWGSPVGGTVINNYNITDAGGANSNTNKALAQVIATLKTYGILAS